MCKRIRRESCAECVINVSASRDGHRDRLTSSSERREPRRLGVKIWWCSSWRRSMPRQPRTRNCWTSVSSGPTIGWGRLRRLSSHDSRPIRYRRLLWSKSIFASRTWIPKSPTVARRLYSLRQFVLCAERGEWRFALDTCLFNQASIVYDIYTTPSRFLRYFFSFGWDGLSMLVTSNESFKILSSQCLFVEIKEYNQRLFFFVKSIFRDY